MDISSNNKHLFSRKATLTSVIVFALAVSGALWLYEFPWKVMEWKIENANYCTTSDDCEVIAGVGNHCYWWCGVVVNKQESSHIRELLKDFKGRCPVSSCAHKLEEISPPYCSLNKCVFGR